MVVMSLFMSLYSACESDPVVGPGDNTTESSEKREVFDTVSDMKAAGERFVGKTPLYVETKGYRAPGDGGGAVYLVTDEKPLNPREDLSGKLYAVVVATDGSVNPKQFGAYADDLNNDSIYFNRALLYAAAHDVTVEIPEGEYRIMDTLRLSDVEVVSNNAMIKFYSMQVNAPAVLVGDNTTIRGKLRIWSIDNEVNNNGSRCGMMFGDYQTGVGASNCYVEDVEITGGVPNSNGVFITGDSENITIDRIYVPTGTQITRPLLLHWGNAGDHYVTSLENRTYGHVENYGPTTHPHDIHIGLIECYGINSEPSDAGIFFVSACYDVYVDKIIVDGARSAVAVIGGDIGFEYASEEVKQIGQRNIVIREINARNISGSGIVISGTPGYNPHTNAGTGTKVTVEKAYIEAAPASKEGAGIWMKRCAEGNFGDITIKGFPSHGILIRDGSENIKFANLTLQNISNHGVYIDPRVGDLPCSDIEIENLVLENKISSSCIPLLVANVNNVSIKNLISRIKSTDYLFSFYSNAYNIKVDSVICEEIPRLSVARMAQPSNPNQNIVFDSVSPTNIKIFS